MSTTAKRLGDAAIAEMDRRGCLDGRWPGLSAAARAEVAEAVGLAVAKETSRIRDEIGNAIDAARFDESGRRLPRFDDEGR
jgi:hypothetical protein